MAALYRDGVARTSNVTVAVFSAETRENRDEVLELPRRQVRQRLDFDRKTFASPSRSPHVFFRVCR
jgi:hypothetical protein